MGTYLTTLGFRVPISCFLDLVQDLPGTKKGKEPKQANIEANLQCGHRVGQDCSICANFPAHGTSCRVEQGRDKRQMWRGFAHACPLLSSTQAHTPGRGKNPSLISEVLGAPQVSLPCHPWSPWSGLSCLISATSVPLSPTAQPLPQSPPKAELRCEYHSFCLHRPLPIQSC